MAKKDRLNYGSMDWDASLDFDFDDTPPKAKGSRKGNKPINHIVDGVTDAMRSKFTDPAHIRSMARKALPSGFGRAWDAIDQVGQDITRLQDEATKELRPQLAHLSRKIDNLIPDSAGRVKRFSQSIREKLDTGGRIDNDYEASHEQQTNQGVERLLAELEGDRAARDDYRAERAEARDMVRDRVEGKRFDIQQRTLGVVANSVVAERRYREGFDMSYKKKSLELQYRSYAAMASLLNNFVQFSKRTAKYQDANLINTSLPEYAKTSTVQRWKANTQENLFNKANQSLFGKTSRVGLAGQRIMKAGREKIGSIKDVATLISDALDMATDTMELDRDMAEIEGRESSGWRTAGSFGGSILGDYVSDKISSFIKDAIKKNPKLMKRSFQAGRMAANPGELIKMARNSERLKKMRTSESETDNKIADGITTLLNLLRGADPEMGVKNMGIGGEYENRDYTRTRTARTINDIIPGYLSRILREITVLRTGDTKTALLSYDVRSGGFKTERRMSAELQATMRKTARTSMVGTKTYKESFGEYSKAFLGDETVDPRHSGEINKFLAGLSRSSDDFAFTGEGMKDTKQYRALSPDARKAVDAILDKRFSGDSTDIEANRYRLATRAEGTRDSMGDLTGFIESAIADGRGPELIRAGIIRRSKDGGYIVDQDRYYQFYDDTTRIKSDVNAKTNIKYTGKGAQGAVNAFRNTQMANWQYKGNTTAQYRGPMAQDIRRNFGNGAAPGGRQIDLVNMNGHMTDAIKGIIEKIDRMNGGEDQQLLLKISQDIETLVKQGRMMTGVGGGGQGGGDGNSFNINTPIGAMAYLAQSLGGKIMSGSRRVGRTAIRLGDAAVDAGDRAWKGSAGLRSSMLEQALGLGRTALVRGRRLGRHLMRNTIPNFQAGIMGAKRSLIDGAKNLFQQTRDLYVEGRQNVAISGELLRIGYYYDAATGKVLKTIDDVTNALGDIKGQDGEVALALKDRAKGLIDGTGAKVKSFLSTAFSTAGGLAMAAFGAGKEQFNKLKSRVKGLPFGGIKDTIFNGRKRLADKFDSAVQNALSKYGIIGGSGGGGSDCCEKTLPVLLQIRDILALGKRGKALSAIMSRSIEPVKSIKPSTNDPAQIENNPEQVGNSLMTQVRDLLAVDKPKDVVKEILNNRGRSVGEFLKAPVVGPKMKRLLDKFQRFTGRGGSGENNGIGSISDLMGPAPQIHGPMPQVANPASSGGIGGTLSALGGLGSAIGGAAGGVMDGLSKRFPGASRRGRILGRGLGRSRLGRLFGRGKREAEGLVEKGQGILGQLMGPQQKEKVANQAKAVDGANKYSAADHDARKSVMNMIQDLKSYTERGSFIDGNGDGKRDGGVTDRKTEEFNARRLNDERNRASKDAALSAAATKASRISPADDAIEKMIQMATKGIAAMSGGAASILETAADTLGDGPGRGRGGRGKKGILRRIGGGLSRAGSWALRGGAALASGAGWMAGKFGSLGRGIQGIARAVPGAARVGRTAVMATRALQVVGLMGGGSGSMLAGAAGLAGSIVSSPVVIGAAAVGGVGYGGYKLYKYFTRDNINDFQKIRILQYGLDGTDATKTYNNKVTALEDYLLDGKLAFSGSTPSLNDRTINMKDVYELFDIAEDDSKMQSRFNEWFGSRFKPVFLHHVAVLYRVDNKAKLTSVQDLPAQKRLDYLSGADISGVWSYTTSPFKGLDVLSDNPKPCRELIDALLKTAGREVNEKAKSGVKSGEAGPKAAEGIAANKPITSAIPAAVKDAPDKYAIPSGAVARTPAATKNTSPVNYGGIPANSRLGRTMAAGEIEEGREPKGAGSGTVNFGQSGGVSGTGNLKIAGGPVSSGESGMQFIKLNKDANIDNLHPRLRQHLLGMAQEYGEATGKSIPINEGFRSYERQAELFRKYGPGRAARPGSSLHEFGLALDINTGVMNELEQMGLLRKYGFTRPIKGETWHTEPSGIQQAIQRAKTDAAFADAGILSSLGRGGGGAGSTPSQKIGGRNPELARAIYEANGGSKVENTPSGAAANLPAGSGNNLQSPMIGGKAAIPAAAVQAAAGPGYASIGRGEGVQSSGGYSAAGSLGDGTGKYDAIKAQIAKHSQEAGADPNKMMLMAAMETGLDPTKSAKNSSASGLLQFLGDTWDEQMGKHGKKYGLNSSRGDVRSQVILGAEYMKSNNVRIRKAAGRDLEMVDEYMGHLLGAGGASSLLRSGSGATAAMILPEQAAANREIFYDRGRPRTVGEMRDFLKGRLDKKAKDFGINLNGGSVQAAPVAATGVDTPIAPTSSPIAYKPTFDVKAPLSPDRIAGLDATSGGLPMFTQGQSGVSAAQPAAKRIAPGGMLAMGNNLGSRDTSMTATTEIMARMTQSADTQIKHLESIDTTIAKQVVPLLEKIAEASANMANMAGAQTGAGGQPGANTGASPKGGAAPTRKEANKSSFDNRRSALTI